MQKNRNPSPSQKAKGRLCLMAKTCATILMSARTFLFPFDGCGYTRRVVQEALGQKPAIIITAECEPHLRNFVAAQWGYSLGQGWARDNDGIPSIYSPPEVDRI